MRLKRSAPRQRPQKTNWIKSSLALLTAAPTEKAWPTSRVTLSLDRAIGTQKVRPQKRRDRRTCPGLPTEKKTPRPHHHDGQALEGYQGSTGGGGHHGGWAQHDD